LGGGNVLQQTWFFAHFSNYQNQIDIQTQIKSNKLKRTSKRNRSTRTKIQIKIDAQNQPDENTRKAQKIMKFFSPQNSFSFSDVIDERFLFCCAFRRRRFPQSMPYIVVHIALKNV
jgi:hypothetical protein